MNRSLKLSMLVALALGSSQVMALDLGQVQVKSALGQPLLAEIPLHPESPEELQNLSVRLASSEEFARAGIVGGRTSIPLNFSVANAGTGHPVIRITSSSPVDDPFLELLIEVDGKAGKSVREFAILLDPPNAPSVVAATPAPSRPATSRAPVRPAAAAPAAAKHRPVAAAPQPAAAKVVDGQYGPVERGQTLSGIAVKVAPSGVDVKQMILALRQANPDAFYREKMFLLLMSARSFRRVFRSVLCCCRLARLSLVRSRSWRIPLTDLAPAALPFPAAPLPSFAGTRARRSLVSDGAAAAPEFEGRVAASARTAGVPVAPARQSLFCRRTSSAAAAIVIACASAEVGTRSTTPLFRALILSR